MANDFVSSDRYSPAVFVETGKFKPVEFVASDRIRHLFPEVTREQLEAESASDTPVYLNQPPLEDPDDGFVGQIGNALFGKEHRNKPLYSDKIPPIPTDEDLEQQYGRDFVKKFHEAQPWLATRLGAGEVVQELQAHPNAHLTLGTVEALGKSVLRIPQTFGLILEETFGGDTPAKAEARAYNAAQQYLLDRLERLKGAKNQADLRFNAKDLVDVYTMATEQRFGFNGQPLSELLEEEYEDASENDSGALGPFVGEIVAQGGRDVASASYKLKKDLDDAIRVAPELENNFGFRVWSTLLEQAPQIAMILATRGQSLTVQTLNNGAISYLQNKGAAYDEARQRLEAEGNLTPEQIHQLASDESTETAMMTTPPDLLGDLVNLRALDAVAEAVKKSGKIVSRGAIKATAAGMVGGAAIEAPTERYQTLIEQLNANRYGSTRRSPDEIATAMDEATKVGGAVGMIMPFGMDAVTAFATKRKMNRQSASPAAAQAVPVAAQVPTSAGVVLSDVEQAAPVQISGGEKAAAEERLLQQEGEKSVQKSAEPQQQHSDTGSAIEVRNSRDVSQTKVGNEPVGLTIDPETLTVWDHGSPKRERNVAGKRITDAEILDVLRGRDPEFAEGIGITTAKRSLLVRSATTDAGNGPLSRKFVEHLLQHANRGSLRKTIYSKQAPRSDAGHSEAVASPAGVQAGLIPSEPASVEPGSVEAAPAHGGRILDNRQPVALDGSPVSQIAGVESTLPAVESAPFALAMRQAYETMGIQNVPRLRLVRNMDEVSAHTEDGNARTIVGDTSIPEAFYERDGDQRTITIVLDGAAQVASDRGISLELRVRQLALHEIVHHFQSLGALLPESARREYNDIVEKVLEHIGRSEREALAKLYKLDLATWKGRAQLAEEYLARFFERKTSPPGWVQRQWARLLDLFRRVFPRMKWTDTDLRMLLESARQKAEAMREDAGARDRRSSQSEHTLRQIGEVFVALANGEFAFQFRREVTGTTPEEVARQLSRPARPISGTVVRPGHIRFQSPNGELDVLQPAAEPWKWIIYSPRAGSAGQPHGGGTQLYQAVFAWAHNNGITVQPSESLSDINKLRRTSNMLSSALRFGTTRHFRPDSAQGVEWQPGNHVHNIGALAKAEADRVFALFPELEKLTIDPGTLTIREHGRDPRNPESAGQPVSDADIISILRRGDSDFTEGVGIATVKRSILVRSVSRGVHASALSGRIVEHLLQHPDRGGLKEVIYSRHVSRSETETGAGAEQSSPEAGPDSNHSERASGTQEGAPELERQDRMIGKVSASEMSRLGRLLSAVAASKHAFQFPVEISATTPDDVAGQISTGVRKIEGREVRPGHIKFQSEHGEIDLYQPSATPWKWVIDAPRAESQGKPLGGGTQLYQAAFAWAHNNGVTIQPSSGLWEINKLRRTSNMLSSALRFGTTRHLRPDPAQGVAWQSGNHMHNIGALAVVEANLVFKFFPEFAGLTIDPETLTISDHGRTQRERNEGGRQVADSEILDVLRRGDPKFTHGVGLATVKRSLLVRSATGDAGQSAFSSIFVEHLLQHPDRGGLTEVFYSRQAPSSTVPERDGTALIGARRIERGNSDRRTTGRERDGGRKERGNHVGTSRDLASEEAKFISTWIDESRGSKLPTRRQSDRGREYSLDKSRKSGSRPEGWQSISREAALRAKVEAILRSRRRAVVNQSEIDAAPFRGTGIRGGIRLTDGMYAAIEKRLAKLTPKGEQKWSLVRNADEYVASKKAAALFNYRTGTMYFRSNATYFDYFHEMVHARQRAALGLEEYLKLRTIGREMHVFDEIVKHHTRFTSAELEKALDDALQYEIEFGPKSLNYLQGR